MFVFITIINLRIKNNTLWKYATKLAIELATKLAIKSVIESATELITEQVIELATKQATEHKIKNCERFILRKLWTMLIYFLVRILLYLSLLKI